MNIEELHLYCLSKKHVTESFPFDKATLVFKVADKMFALTSLERLPFAVNLKCDPDEAVLLREQFSAVTPAYHMNKKHWNTVFLEKDMNNVALKKWIDHSYKLVICGFTKKKQKELGF